MTFALQLLLILSFSIGIITWLIIYFALRGEEEVHSASHNPPVSIIIACRNDFDQLFENVDAFLSQQYPEFEIVVVDDHSFAGSEALKEKLKEKGISVLHSQESVGKKGALKTGIENARFDFYLLTDADCVPASPYWIRSMVASAGTADVVVGYGGYSKERSLLNSVIRYESIQTAIMYFAMLKTGFPYMAVGRNLLYTSRAYRASSKFERDKALKSGDDDLHVQEMATHPQIDIKGNFEKEGHTYSIPSRSWSSYLKQKRRHVSTANKYNLASKVWLAAFHFGQTGFYLFLIMTLFLNPHVAIILYIIRITVVWIVVRQSSKWLGDTFRGPLPLTEFLLFIFYLVISPSIWRVKNEW